MQITGKVVGTYPEVEGSYLGSSYRYMNVIVVSDDRDSGSGKRDRFVVKFKNDMMAQAEQSGCLDGSTSYVFTVIADADERRRQDGTKYATPRAMLCTNIGAMDDEG